MSRNRWCLLFGAMVLLAASPAWANYAWGSFFLLRPGVQAGIIFLTLAAETVVFRFFTGLAWHHTAIAVTGANLFSGLIGSIFVEPNVLSLGELAIYTIVSCFLEAIVLVTVAERYVRGSRHFGAKLGQPQLQGWLGLCAANVTSALVISGYALLLFHGTTGEIMVVRSRPLMIRSFASALKAVASQPDRNLRQSITTGSGQLYVFNKIRSLGEQRVDIAPKWAPWSKLRTMMLFEFGEVPEVLDPPDAGGRPLIWTGGPWVHGQRSVIFTDGSLMTMSEQAFQKLGAVPQPLPQWLLAALAEHTNQSSSAGTSPTPPNAPATGSPPSPIAAPSHQHRSD